MTYFDLAGSVLKVSTSLGAVLIVLTFASGRESDIGFPHPLY